MAEDDTLFYNDEPPEPNIRKTMKVSGPWGTLEFTPSRTLVAKLAQLEHVGRYDVGSPERALEGLGDQVEAHIELMVRHEGRDPERSVDLGDPATNPYLRRRLDTESVDSSLHGDISALGVGGSTLQLAMRSALSTFGATEADGEIGAHPYPGNFRWHPKREWPPSLHLVGGMMADTEWYGPENDPETIRSDGLSDSDVEDIIDASPGPDLR